MTAPTPGFSELARTARVVICSGPGGVGKTTTAAAIGVEAALEGRRVVVVTIDPAKRLADALGLAGGLTNEPARIDLPARVGPAARTGRSRSTRPKAATATAPGELWAVMLDTRATFDGIVRRYSGTPDQAEAILANPFYRNISGALSGTQEYMAAEKLYELHHDDRFDLVVVDTPPTRNALDFLDAPGRLTRFLDHRLYKALMLPTRVGLRVVNVAAQVFLKSIAKVVGGDVIADVMAFFQAFDGMEAGFRSRAEAVTGLLQAPTTRYVVVTSPRREAVAEARYFAGRLRDHHLQVAAVVVNRMHPRFDQRPAAELRAEADAARASGSAGAEGLANLAELVTVAEGESAMVEPLLAETGAVPVATVPLLVNDVHDLGGLAEIARHLFASPAVRG